MSYCPDCKQDIRIGGPAHTCPESRQRKALSPSGATACSAGWLHIESAPTDGSEIIVYCPPAHGLRHMAGVCAYHEDAGFCVDELREPTLWIPLPNEISPSVDAKEKEK